MERDTKIQKPNVFKKDFKFDKTLMSIPPSRINNDTDILISCMRIRRPPEYLRHVIVDAVKYLNSFREFWINPRYQKPSASLNDITCSRQRLQFAPHQSTIIVHLTFFAHWSIIISNRGLEVNESCLTITNDWTNLLLGHEPNEHSLDSA